MAQTSDDKELILGNKQLISLFFVVVALCGVFFAMGYMIGRNSGKASLTADGSSPSASGTGTASQRQQPEPPRETAQATPDTGNPPAADPTPASATETRPAQDTPPSPRLPTEAPAPPPYAGEPKPPGTTVPEAGASYVQVTAIPHADAEGVARTLREQNFPTIIATSSKDGMFRVLVGPYHQTAELADAKARLKAMGYGGAFVQKQ